jgi:DHA1 family tetracycline resistance protein-like MFS transporter
MHMPVNSKIKAIILTLFAVIFIDAIGWGMVFPIFIPIILDNVTHILPATFSNNLRYLTYELLIATYCVFMFLFSPILGALSDKYGRKIILLLSMFGSCLGFLMSATGIYCNSLGVIVLGRVLSGATAGSLSIAQAAMADISTEVEKPKRLGLIAIANGIGFTLGPLLGGFSQTISPDPLVNNSLAFMGSSLLALIGGFLVLLCFNETFVKNTAASIKFLGGFFNIYEAFVAQEFRVSVTCFFLSMTGYILFFNMIPIFLNQRFNASGETVGYFLSYFAIVYAFSLWVLLPQVLHRFSLSTLAKASILIQVIFYILFAMNHSIALSYLTLFPVAAASPILYVALISIVSNKASSLNQGKMMGVMGSVTALTWALGPILVGSMSGLGMNYCFAGSVILMLMGMWIISKDYGLGESTVKLPVPIQ